MTRVRVGIAAALALMLVVGSARADTKDKPDKPDKSVKPTTQDKDKPTRPPDRPPRERPDAGFPGGRYYNMPLLSERDIKALNLKDEQKEKVEKLVKDYHDKQTAEMKKIREMMEKAREKRDPDALRELQPKMRALFQGFQKSRKEGLDKIKALLNEDQKKKLEEIARRSPFGGPGDGPFGRGPRGGFAPGQILPPFMREQLKLTKEQKEELDKLQKDVDAKLKKLLTEEQQRMLQRFSGPPGGRPGGFPPPPPPRERD